MAIVIEDDKKRSSLAGILNILVWLVVVGAAAAGVYYLFFKRPDLITNMPVPSNFQNTQALSQVTLSPDVVLKHPRYQVFQTPAVAVPNGMAGRPNPFVPF